MPTGHKSDGLSYYPANPQPTTLSSSPYRRTGLRFHLPLPLAFALVVQLLSFCNRQFTLDPAILQIDLGGDEGQPFFARRSQQLVDFPAMQQQFTPARRLVILAVAMRVLADMS